MNKMTETYTEKIEPHYTREFKTEDGISYDKAWVYLDCLANHRKFYDDLNICEIFFDENESKAARLAKDDGKIELSDFVDAEIVAEVEKILNLKTKPTEAETERGVLALR